MKPIFSFGSFSRGYREGLIGKIAKVLIQPVNYYARPPCPVPPKQANANTPAGIVAWNFRVPAIFSVGYISKVGKAIVQAITVGMVDFIRHFAGHQPPNDPMGIYARSNYLTVPVSGIGNGGKSSLSRTPSVPAFTRTLMLEPLETAGLPKKEASLRVIFEQLTQNLLRGHIAISHVEPRSFAIGQGCVGVGSTSRPVPFIPPKYLAQGNARFPLPENVNQRTDP
ncbi:MAG: hypothetical protein MEQ74_01005 [Paracoccus sp.]|nr:hypothetical protein [Paracoccus sp. (in: a-proteobacteria)]